MYSEMLIILLLIAILIVSFWYVAIKPLDYWKKKGVSQGTPRWLFGDSMRLILKMESFAEFLDRMYQRFPKKRYSGIYQLSAPSLLIHDPDTIKQITVKDFDHFVDHRTFVPEHNDPLWGKNLFALKGERWKDMRPILSPQFTSSKMRSIFLLMTDSIQTFIENLSKMNKETIEFDIKDTVGRLGVDVIASIAFGVKVDSMSQPKNQFYLLGREATDFSGFAMKLKFLGYQIFPIIFDVFNIRFFSSRVTNFFTSVVDETIKSREEKGVIRQDLIQLLVEKRKGIKKHEENGVIDTGFATVLESTIEHIDDSGKSKNITNADIAAQAMIFFFGGFDTTVNTISFILYELAINPDIQEKLREEINETRKECGDKVNYETLMKMQYIDMVVSETLRKWPQGLQLDRICTKPYTIEPKYPDEKPVHLQVGDVILVPTFGIHRDPKYYPNPDKFDPERFNNENKQKINPYAYLPFGLGPRNCIGSRFALLEAKTLLFYLLSNYEVVPTNKTTIPPRISRNTFSLVLEGGFYIGLKPLRS